MIRRPSDVLRGILLLVLARAGIAVGTPLDDYVAAPDSSFTYSVANTITDSGYTAYVMDMTSQTWRTPAEVDRTLWQHWLTIIVPNAAPRTRGLLIVEGGENGGAPPDSTEGLDVLATVTRSVVAYLQMVPNQKLKFADETDPRYIAEGRKEDELIAYTWDKFLRTGDATWPAQLPMTKAAVRALDTVQEFCATPEVGSLTIDDFVVVGGSKRGWVTWLTAAVDTRVAAIMPAVIDVLNVEASMTHHVAAYGFWSSAVQDYVDMGVMNWFGTPEFSALTAIIDPYVYRDRYTMPKFIVNASGDQFFLPDSSQFYWDDLPGEKHLRYVQNADHSMGENVVGAGSVAVLYYYDILTDAPRHQFSWTLEPDGSIRLETVDVPDWVGLWQATNPTARDFRLETIGTAWTSTQLSDQGGGVYVGQVSAPPAGWTAFFIEVVFDSAIIFFPYRYSTQVRVVPEPATLDLDVVNALWGRVVQVDPNFPRYFEPNAVATLTAEPTGDRAFSHWDVYDPTHPGDANHVVVDTNNPISVLMTGDRQVVAVFKCGAAPGHLLGLGVIGLAAFGLLVRRGRRSAGGRLP